MLPASEVPVPRVAELPTCQNTPQLEALLISTTDAALAVVSGAADLEQEDRVGVPLSVERQGPVNWAEVEKQ